MNRTEISFLQMDFLNEKNQNRLGSFDIIVSNPPYVRHSEKKAMKKNVLDYEPELALFVKDDDPLIFYRAIAAFGAEHLIQKGKIFCEINEFLTTETCDLFEHKGYQNVEICKDMSGKNRILKADL